MKSLARAPIWLRIAAVAMIGESLAVFALDSITPARAIAPAVGLLLAWFLLRGSRVAWVFVFLSAIAELASPLTLSQPPWHAGFAAILLGCLLASSSRAFVWSHYSRQADGHPPAGSRGGWRDRVWRAQAWLQALAYGSLTGEGPGKNLTRGEVIGPLTACVVILFVLAHLLNSARHGFGSGNVLVAVLYRVTWVTYSFALLGLIVLFAAAAYRYFSERQARKTSP